MSVKLDRRATLSILLVIAGLWSGLLPDVEGAERPMNFLFLLVDDLGWADLGCYGSQFHETPHIDALSASGMRFTQAYAAGAVCSPTRASIMTGRHPVRVDITDWIPGMRADAARQPRFLQVNDRDHLALEELTVAELLRAAGYQTFFAGKWHLGGEGFLPTDQGFDFNVGGFSAGSPPGGYYAPWNNPYLQHRHEGEYLTERLTDESVQFLERRNSDQPFMLYLSYYNVHTPITAYEKTLAHFETKAAESFRDPTPWGSERDATSRLRQDRPDYASMVSAVDRSVGRVLSALERLHLADQTAVFFFSDNGGLCTLPRKSAPTSNLPLRSGKGWLYEGGIREPLIVRVPQVTSPGSVSDQVVVSMDFLPTIVELSGASLENQAPLDGVSLVPWLRGAAGLQERTLYWHYPHYHGSAWRPGAAIRSGDWKLIEFYESGSVELYNLVDDVGEQSDLSESEPERTDQLRRQLRSWQMQLGARMPVRRQDFDESRDGGRI